MIKRVKLGARLWSLALKISFHMIKNDSLQPNIYEALKTFLTLKLSQHRKNGSTLSSRELFVAISFRLGNTLCLCSPVRSAQAVSEHCPNLAPKSLAIDFAD